MYQFSTYVFILGKITSYNEALFTSNHKYVDYKKQFVYNSTQQKIKVCTYLQACAVYVKIIWIPSTLVDDINNSYDIKKILVAFNGA